jgi:streptomycin 6-kinase
MVNIEPDTHRESAGLRFRIPAGLSETAEWGPERAAWLAGLPGVVEAARRRWELSEIGAPFEPGGMTAWVAPARDRDGADVVLKLCARHAEALDEAAGLREWDGAGTVRVLADVEIGTGTIALLLERCRPGSSLASRPGEEQDSVLADLLPRLWKSPPHAIAFRPLSQMCDEWVTGFRRRHPDGRGPAELDRSLIHAGLTLFSELPRNAETTVLLGTDIHAENVISAEREPWLVIDPKPYVGDPTYDVLQHMLNTPERLAAHPRAFIGRIAGLFELDPQRLSLWLFARCVLATEQWPELAETVRQLTPK